MAAIGLSGYLWWNSRATVTPLSPAAWIPLTHYSDSAVSPALSPDGRMLTFIRGRQTFFTPGEIYVKMLPDGEPVHMAHDPRPTIGPAFSPDGSRIAYGTVERRVFGWDTWVAPVLGGEPKLMLPNATGLTWLSPQRVLFSEIQAGRHMGLISATESRGDPRSLYWPEKEFGMVHRSWLSPDGKQVLLAEMGNSWEPCRLIPADGSSPGRKVGPEGGWCTY